jgi:hypothetical protein
MFSYFNINPIHVFVLAFVQVSCQTCYLRPYKAALASYCVSLMSMSIVLRYLAQTIQAQPA